MTEEQLQQALEGATDEIKDLKKQITKLQYQVWQGEADKRVVSAMESQRALFRNLIETMKEKMKPDAMVSKEKVIAALEDQFEFTEAQIMEQIKPTSCKS